jgi:ribulose-5-phosphate 4-epimerase/fuculose-1-phosphate aldolase
MNGLIVNKLLYLTKHISKYCVGMEGNISGKYENSILIKASGTKLSTLSNKDLVEYDFFGNQKSSFEKKGSIELSFHTYLLSFEGINFISHTHPTNVLKILCSDEYSYSFANKRLFPDQVVFNGKKSCLIPYAKPGEGLTKKIKKHVNLFIEEEGYFPKLILLENHGIISCGSTVDECIVITEICDKSADIWLGSKLLGDIRFLTDEQVCELIDDVDEKYRKELLK